MVFIKDAQELEHVNLAQLKSEDGASDENQSSRAP